MKFSRFYSHLTLKTYNFKIMKHLVNQGLQSYKSIQFFTQMGVSVPPHCLQLNDLRNKNLILSSTSNQVL